MKNQYSEGNAVEITAAPYDVVSGAGCLMGSLFGVASFDALSTKPVTVYTKGTYTLKAVASQAWTQGALVYWDDTNKYCTTTSSGNKLIGVASLARASGASIVTGVVRLNGAALS